MIIRVPGTIVTQVCKWRCLAPNQLHHIQKALRILIGELFKLMTGFRYFTVTLVDLLLLPAASVAVT